MDFDKLVDNGLYQLSQTLASDEKTLFGYYRWLDSHIRGMDATVKAFLLEDDRAARLEKEIQFLLERFPEVENRPPLFGIPIGVKDIFHVEGFETRGGSKLPPDRLIGEQAVSVTRLKDAGAVIYGKTVTTEFAYFAPGPTRNPHNLNHTPGGSSSGSAAAVGAGMIPLALGTQTIGSIIRPAAFCGVIGFKPSYERISRAGVIPLASSLDHIGFFTRNIEDATLVASILVKDWRDVSSKPMPTLGVPQGPYLRNASEEGLNHFEKVQARLAKAGFKVVPVPVMADFDEIRDRHNIILAAEAGRVHGEWFREFEGLYHFKTTELIRTGMKVSYHDLQAALQGRERLRTELERAADKAGIDVWISPSAPGVAPEGLESTGDPVMNLPWTHSGLPSVGIPSGYNEDDLPFGIQVVGGWYEDETLLSWAKALERELSVD